MKYYKGLGTSTNAEAKQYFSDLHKHVIQFKHGSVALDEDAITLAFSKTKADLRKEWLQQYDPKICIDHNLK
jgi:DNA topoisomerase II